MKDTLILKDGSAIELEAGASLSDIRVASENKESMVSTWDRLTERNLSEVQVKNGDGLTVGRYSGLVLVNETSAIQEDGTILTSFNLREKTEIELLREEVNLLKEGQEVQDGAISDLGEAISNVVEGGLS